MKQLMLIAALVAAQAHAHTVLVADNAIGGTMHLTDVRCTVKGKTHWHTARSTDRNGKTVLTGCWKADGTDILVHWKNGERLQSQWERWDMTPYARRKYVTDMELESLFGTI